MVSPWMFLLNSFGLVTVGQHLVLDLDMKLQYDPSKVIAETIKIVSFFLNAHLVPKVERHIKTDLNNKNYKCDACVKPGWS